MPSETKAVMVVLEKNDEIHAMWRPSVVIEGHFYPLSDNWSNTPAEAIESFADGLRHSIRRAEKNARRSAKRV